MSRSHRFQGLCLMSLATAALATAALAAGPAGKAAVQAELLADTNGVSAGQSFRLGVLFHIEPGWHIYWKDPGDAGLATSVQFSVPEGYAAGELRWPVHTSWSQPGDIQGNGYSGSVLLSAVVQAPGAPAFEGKALVAARVRWLACKEVCVPGKAELKLELPALEAPGVANQDLFTAWEQKLPPSLNP